jgi:LmbE family N-acetylglucosaminyl deacetylase
MRMLALSPHLDDAVFSCGATLARLADRGARVALVTAFTCSVPDPRGFALACQTDKGLQPGVDYMALRRAEDHAAASVLGIADVMHLNLPEAPHRGYNSAAELFGKAREDDTIDQAIRAQLSELDQPELVLAPRGLGGHVDHRRLIAAIPERWRPVTVLYRDTPYALRVAPTATDAADQAAPIAAQLDRKLDACAAYTTQLGFQFGGETAMRRALREFADAEGRRLRAGGPAEALAVPASRSSCTRSEDQPLAGAILEQLLGATIGVRLTRSPPVASRVGSVRRPI